MKKLSLCPAALATALFAGLLASAQTPNQQLPAREAAASAEPSAAAGLGVCPRCIRADMEFLASDALHGRGSGTRDEWIAATYVASRLEEYGVEPAGDDGDYVQRVPVPSLANPGQSFVWSAIGKIPGAGQQVILLAAHLDHLGIGPPVHGDRIYNGADDDASGVTAVLELARVLAAQPKPHRTIVFALFGGEEAGLVGSSYFREHPPVPLENVVAYLEFEMIGRRDPAVPKDTLWLTGWERTNLGPTLAAHGAHLVGDPHPAQDFFRRSDNYAFARKGVVAQTVSSYGLHSDYHQPSDELSRIDFDHMNAAIESLLEPVLWLVNSDFTPQWNKGGKP